jgi:hypothetical protein
VDDAAVEGLFYVAFVGLTGFLIESPTVGDRLSGLQGENG